MIKKPVLAVIGTLFFLAFASGIYGDLNGDGQVNFADLNIALSEQCDVGSSVPCDDNIDPEFVAAVYGANEDNSFELDSCQSIEEPGFYVLTQNVESDGTCFEIEADNVVLVCDGHTIEYSKTQSGSAVFASSKNHLAVIGCNIVDGEPGVGDAQGLGLGTESPGIKISHSQDVLVKVNNIETDSIESPGVEFNSVRGVVSSNIVETHDEESPGISVISSPNLVVEDNIIESHESEGIYLKNVNVASVSNNMIDAETGVRVTNFLINQVFSDNEVEADTGFSFDLQQMFDSSQDIGSPHVLNDPEYVPTVILANNDIDADMDLEIENPMPETRFWIIDQEVENYDFSENGVLLTLVNSGVASIEFMQPVFEWGIPLSEATVLDYNFAGISTDFIESFENQMKITLYDLPDFGNPAILRDGDVCEECIALTGLNEDDVSFIAYFEGIYSIEENDEFGTTSNETNETLFAQDEDLLDEFRSGGSCLTGWTCSEWSACVDEQQTRTCTKEVVYCYADPETRPVQVQSCTVSQTGSEDETPVSRAFSAITGAVTGVLGNPRGLFGIIVFLVIVGGASAVVAYRRNSKN